MSPRKFPFVLLFNGQNGFPRLQLLVELVFYKATNDVVSAHDTNNAVVVEFLMDAGYR